MKRKNNKQIVYVMNNTNNFVNFPFKKENLDVTIPHTILTFTIPYNQISNVWVIYNLNIIIKYYSYVDTHASLTTFTDYFFFLF